MKKSIHLFFFTIFMIGITVLFYFIVKPITLLIGTKVLKIVFLSTIIIMYLIIIYMSYKKYIKHLNERIEAKRVQRFIDRLSKNDANPFIRFMFSVVSEEFFRLLDKSNRESPRVKSYEYKISCSESGTVISLISIKLKGFYNIDISVLETHIVLVRKHITDIKDSDVKEFKYSDYSSNTLLMEDIVNNIK